VKLREFRRADGARLFQLMKSEFPEEEQMLGMRPEGFEALLRRLYRADVRIPLGLLRAFHRSPFHLYVIEEDGGIAATTLLSFAARAGFLSNVVVAPAFRRRGFARRLIERAREEAASRQKPYIALRVLEGNAPARALYAAAGYQELDWETFAVHDVPSSFVAPDPTGAIRPFRRSDAAAVAELANRLSPPKVRDVLPVRAADLAGGGLANRILGAETAAWVVDRGRGPEAHVAATSTATTEAAHLSTAIVGEAVEPALAADLVRTAGRWLVARKPARIVTSVSRENLRGHRALEETGFHDAIGHLTLYRPSA
jgi:ribosomal protein S18 acetylase RimI-like enzyme